VPSRLVQHCQRDFADSISSSLNFLREAQAFRVLQPGGVYRDVSVRTSELFAGLALLRICLAWEEFLESVFVRYMCGAISGTGFAPILLLARERSITTAMTRLLGGGGRYLNWSPRNTRIRAVTYFDRGEPFSTAVIAGGAVLDEIFIVRNRFAHRSEFAAQEFRAVLNTRIGYVPRGMTAGRFLLTNSPVAGQTFAEYYASTLLGVSLVIVP
jgi:hypothetical protein